MTQKEIISLYERYRIRLYNTCYRLVGASDIAEELMHDTLLKYLRSDVRPASEQQRSAWLTRTAIRSSIDWLRRRGREKLFLEQYAREAVCMTWKTRSRRSSVTARTTARAPKAKPTASTVVSAARNQTASARPAARKSNYCSFRKRRESPQRP